MINYQKTNSLIFSKSPILSGATGIFLILLALFSGCTESSNGMTPETTDVHNDIIAANKVYMETFSNGDAAGMAALFTESAQYLIPYDPSVTGRQGIQAKFQSIMDRGVASIKLEVIETEGFGSTAYEVGKYTTEDREGKAMEQGKYIIIWKKEEGIWKMHRDIANYVSLQ